MQMNSTISFLHSSTPPLQFNKTPPYTPTTTTTTPQIFTTRSFRRTIRTPQTSIRVSSSDNQTVTVESPTTLDTKSASHVVRSFYEGINGHDLASVEDLIADNCVYEDLIFARPFVGRKAILEFFKKFINTISRDLQFIIDDMSSEDSSCVGVMWHLGFSKQLIMEVMTEWKGKPFPFSKGCSFYRLEVMNGKRQIVYGRDSVEPAIKPGETALVAIRGVIWLLQQFPQLADQL